MVRNYSMGRGDGQDNRNSAKLLPDLTAFQTLEGCGARLDLSERTSAIARAGQVSRSGKAFRIGESYIRQVDGFHLVGGQRDVIESEGDPTTRPASSVIGDDTYLKHFRRMLGKTYSPNAALIGGMRPDLLGQVLKFVSGKEVPYLPVTLMVPFAARIGSSRVELELAINFEPPDMEMLQRITSSAKYLDGAKAEIGSRVGGGATLLRDPDLKLYLKSAQIAFPELVDTLFTEGPISGYVLRFLQREERPIEIAYLGTRKGEERNRWAVAVPNVPPMEATALIRRQRGYEASARLEQMLVNAFRLNLETSKRPLGGQQLTSEAIETVFGSDPLARGEGRSRWKKASVTRSADGQVRAVVVIDEAAINSHGPSGLETRPIRAGGGRVALYLVDLENAEEALWASNEAARDLQRINAKIREVLAQLRNLAHWSTLIGRGDEARGKFIRLMNDAIGTIKGLEDMRDEFQSMGLHARLSGVDVSWDEKTVLATINGISETIEIMERALRPITVAEFRKRQAAATLPMAQSARPVAYYDADRLTLLYALDEEDLEKVLETRAPSNYHDAGKLRVRIDLASLHPEPPQTFPFPVINFDLFGEGHAVTLRVRLDKEGSSDTRG